MKKSKRFCALSVFAVMTLLLLGWLAATASAAGGIIISDTNSYLGGGFSLGGDGPYYGSNLTNDSDTAAGSFWLNLDPDKVSFENSNWSFYTSHYDPSWWTATCTLYGNRYDKEVLPQKHSWSQSISQASGLKITASTYVSADQYDSDTGVERYLSLGGYFSIKPVEYANSSFSYVETMRDIYKYPNGYDNPPVITQIPVWEATFQMNGHFLADTPELAHAMGLAFVQPVPEPSMFALMASGIVAIGFVIWRLPAQAGKKR